MNVSKNNLQNKLQADTRRVPHWSLRKLSVGVASVLLGTTFYFGMSNVAHADVVSPGQVADNNAQVTQAGSQNAGLQGNEVNLPAVNSGASEPAAKGAQSGANGSATGAQQAGVNNNSMEGQTPGQTAGTPSAANESSQSAQPVSRMPFLILAAQPTSGAGSADAASSVFSVGDTTNSMVVSQVSGSPVEGVTKQVNNAVWAVSESESATPVGQANAGADNLNAPVPNRQTSVAGGNPSKEHLSDNLSLSVNQNSNFNFSSLLASKVALTGSNNAVNGGFDEAMWGTLDVNNWKGSVQGDYYQLTDYTGDANHVIVPNAADFEKAGISTSGKQVGVTSSLMHRIFTDKTTAQDATVAFSKTDNKMVKAINADWHSTWGHRSYYNSKGNLSKFDGINLDVSNVTNMSDMFSSNRINDLSSLVNWKVDNVTYMNYMFYNNRIIDLSPLANWKTDNVTNMSEMFISNQIDNLSPLANWKVDNVTNMNYMFYNNRISDLSPLANWKVDNVTDMSGMFSSNQIDNLSSLANWNVNNVTDMTEMFDDNHISDLSSLANWNVNNVTDMTEMFESNQVSDLNPLANWNVNNVTDMSEMFDYNYSIQTKNLQAKHVINFAYPVDYTGKKQDPVTQTIDVPQRVKVELTTKDSKPSNNILDWVTKTETPETPDPVYFQDYTVPEIKGLLEPDKTVIAGQQADVTKPINVTVTYKLVESDTNDAFALDSKNGLHEHANVNDNGGYDIDFWGTLDASKFTTVKNGDNLEITGYTGDAAKVIIPNIADFELNNLDQGAKQVTISSQVMHQLAKNATRIGLSKTGNQKVVSSDAIWQDAFGGMTNDPQTGDNADGGMWVYNPNLTAMDLHNLDTTNITDMGSMFNGGRNLNVVGDLSQWNVANVVDMGNMFQSASSLTNIGDLSNWDTSNVTDMSFMFQSASKLKDLGNLGRWKTGNVTDMSRMFNGDVSLTNIGDLSNWDTSNVTDMSYMFQSVSKLKDLGNLDHWKTGNVGDMSFMFSNMPALTNVGDLSHWDTNNVQSMSYMFNNDGSLISLGDLSNWDTHNVWDMSFMFQLASKLTNLGNLDNWETGNVMDMSRMFNGDVSLTNIGDLSNWDTSNVTNMSFMFQSDSKLENLGNLGRWKTGNVTDMSFMFNNMSALTNVGDLSRWDTHNVENMTFMFNNDGSLISIGDLSNWDTSNVTNMSFMFQLAGKLKDLGNLDSWQIGKVTDMSRMFNYAESLTNIGDLSNWDTHNVTNMSFMFQNDSKLKNLGNLGSWQTGNVTDMSYMFVSTNVLRHLNISNWDLTKLANKDSMKYMFANDINLTVIANDLKLPAWYQNEINDADYFWSNHMAVITNVPELIRSTGDIDNLKIDKQDASRSIFYDSKGSSDVIQVLKDANQAYVKQYQSEHPGYALNLVADVDQTDSLALANARFVSVPREVQFMIAYYDLTGKMVNSTTSTHKVGETVSISPVAPVNYVLANGQLRMNYLMHWGLNKADFLVTPKVTMTTQSKSVFRTITVQTPDGQTNNVVQTVTFTRNGYLNQVTKQTTYSPWSFGGQYQFNGYQPKPMDGYTAETVPAVSVTPDSSDTTVNVAYHPISAAYSVDYQLVNGTVVKKMAVTPDRDGTIHLTAPQGYRLLTTVTDVQVGHSSQKLTVLVVPAEQTYTAHETLPNTVTEPLSKTVTRTVKITLPNGHVRTVKQSVKFERTVTVKADGTVKYSDWQAIGRAQFNKVFVAKRHGYHLVITDASGKALSGVDKINNVTAAMDDVVVSVKYVKN